MRIITVKTRKELKQFIDFPYRLYQDDGNYVPDLYLAQQFMFNRKKNPFFRHSEAEFFMALRDGRVIGRIAAIKNNVHNQLYQESRGFFGFFEVIDSYPAAEALLERVVQWCRDRNFSSLTGPENYTTNDSCGLLVKGFEFPPAVKMPYNKPYYNDYLVAYGFKTATDLFAYRLQTDIHTPRIERLYRRAEADVRRRGIVIRNIDMRNFDREIAALKEVYNRANRDNWGFVPMSAEEFFDQANDLRRITLPELVFVAEKDGEMIAYFCAVPDMNEILIKIRDGRLFPRGFIRLLLGKKKIKHTRFPILGILPEYRNMSIGISIYAHLHKALQDHNYQSVEASYVMDSNVVLKKMISHYEGVLEKQYRLYDYSIPSPG